jgi:hypothetical protein
MMMTGAVLRGGGGGCGGCCGGGCGGCCGCGSSGRVLSSDEQYASARQSAFRDPLLAVLKLLGDEVMFVADIHLLLNLLIKKVRRRSVSCHRCPNPPCLPKISWQLLYRKKS